MLRRFSILMIAVVLYLGLAATALQADLILYGNSSSSGTPYISAIDPTTGMVIQTYTNLSGVDGRGVAVVGSTIYYTTARDTNVYKESTSGVNEGVAFQVTVQHGDGLATMAYDGTNFYIGAYDRTNHVYKYSPSGQWIETLSLSHCLHGNCDGLEYFMMHGQGYLIENEHDSGPSNNYDLYDLQGNFIRTLFTSTGISSTGIAFDGTDFWTSNLVQGTISEWTINGTFVKTISLTGYGSHHPFLEDLSFDYSQVLTTPEPGTLVLMGTGFLGILGFGRRNVRP
jgi:hypothetical protein